MRLLCVLILQGLLCLAAHTPTDSCCAPNVTVVAGEAPPLRKYEYATSVVDTGECVCSGMWSGVCVCVCVCVEWCVCVCVCVGASLYVF